MNKRYDYSILEEAVKKSFSVAGVLKMLGSRQISGGQHAYVTKLIMRRRLDVSHFTGQGHMKGKTSKMKKPWQAVLVLRTGTPYKEKTLCLRRAMIESGMQYICSSCGMGPIWNNTPITLENDHINGDALDNRRDNVRFLCPNCHSQTPTSSPGKRIAKMTRKDGRVV